MHQHAQEKLKSPTLNDLINDSRLERLFSKNVKPCALQLWVLQVKCGQLIENRIVYGRLLPYNHFDNTWTFSDNNKFCTIDQKTKARVTKLTLYLQSIHCADLLRLLNDRQTITTISTELGFIIPKKLEKEFGKTSLSPTDLAYRPVAYLINRDAYHHSLSSPHGEAGAFSASITQTDKDALFQLGSLYSPKLTKMVVKSLNGDTGMDFSNTDTSRFGDIELLVFPTLDDHERNLLEITWINSPHTLITRFNPCQIPYYGSFQFRLNVENNGQITYSALALAEKNEDGLFECRFELDDQISACIDSTELEIFGFHDNTYKHGTLCSRWQIDYIREMHFQSQVVGHRRGRSFKFDWLEKTTRPADKPRVKTALTINHNNQDYAGHVGGREVDSWVPANREIATLFKRLHPQKSNGLFCLRWNQGNNDGRLQLVEWFKALLAQYQQHQIVIFDPYFEDAGLGLLLLYSVPKSDYIVFRSLPKAPPKDKPQRRKSDKVAQNGINNLLANCEQSHHQLRHLKLRIYGLKEGRLHDRYIIIMGRDGLPITGFHLSNSFQMAAENHPLLITPIPSDTLLDVEEYVLSLIQEAKVSLNQENIENTNMRLLFDSTALPPSTPKRYEPLLFLNKTFAGEVLSIWCSEPTLHGLNSNALKEQMTTLGLLEEESLNLSTRVTSFHNFLDQQADNFNNFGPIWEILGDIFAHSHTNEYYIEELKSEHSFLKFLAHFLKLSFNREYTEIDKNLTVVESQFFTRTIEELLYSPYQPHHLFHTTKYSALTWSEYFAIKFLWQFNPDVLLEIAEKQILDIPTDNQSSKIIRLSLLSQIVSEISLSVQIRITEIQLERLLSSSSALLYWMGLHAIQIELEKPNGLSKAISLITNFTTANQIQALGWMINRATKKSDNIEAYKGLITALHKILPSKISKDEFKSLIDSMRGHMKQLAWAEPWLFQDIISPLLENDRVNVDDACEIWTQELISMLEPDSPSTSLLFDQAREGQTTNICAFLIAHGSSEQQQSSLQVINKVLNQQKKVIQQPLASTSNWSRWDKALKISLWILAFCKWCEYYLSKSNQRNDELEQLIENAQNLAEARPINEWRIETSGQSSGIIAFLNQGESLVASAKEVTTKEY
ncbi:VPA1262 family protein [Acinetobacter baumannii]